MPLASLIRACILLAAATLAAADPGPVVLVPYVSGLTNPVEIAHAGDGSGRLFVVEQAGRVRVVRNAQLLSAPFLDVASLVQSGGEQGLLGLAFHPRYAANGQFFIFHNIAGTNDIAIARYTRSAGNPDLADPASRQLILTIPHPSFGNHNGGKIAFGPDGLLYIGVGDGGGGGDPFNAAQNLGDLRGKILRIDVDSATPYAIYGGLNHWIGYYRAGNSLEAISDIFAGSAEFSIRYGSLDNAQFVNRVYANVLGRAPDAQGFAFWRGQLDSGAMTRGQVMLAFSEGTEFRSLSNNEVYVTMIYAGMLRREPDSGGFAFWLDYMDSGNSGVALINGFLASPEYRNRFL